MMLDSEEMLTWSFTLWAIFISLVVLIGYGSAELIITYYRAGILGRILVFWGFVTVGFLGYTFCLGPEYDVHVHHWLWSGLFVCSLGHPSPIVTVLHGICNGILIEGASRWGFDPVWQLKQSSN